MFLKKPEYQFYFDPKLYSCKNKSQPSDKRYRNFSMAIVYSSVPNRRAGWNKCAGEKILDKLQKCRGENVLKKH